MSGPKKTNMKDKFQAMKVNQPLRLSKEGPGLRAPTFDPPVEEPRGITRPDGETPARELPSGPSPQGAVSPLGDTPVSSRELHPVPVGDSPSRSLFTTSPEGFSPSRSAQISDGEPTRSIAPLSDKPSGSFAERELRPEGGEPYGGNDGPVKDPLVDKEVSSSSHQPLASRDRYLDWKETGVGTLHLPHQLLEYAIKRTSSRNELVVLLFFIRFTLGFRRPQFQVGYSFLSEWTAINDVTNLRKALKTLLAAGLLVKVQSHDSISNTGATYEVPVVAKYLGTGGDDFDPSGPKKLLPELRAASAPGSIIARSAENPPARGGTTEGPVGILPTKKENKKENLNKTLSSELPYDLRAQIERTRPLSKRRREEHALSELLQQYSTEEIGRALFFVKTHGVLGSGQRCHSPYSYLAQAIGEVLLSIGSARQISVDVTRRENPPVPEPDPAFRTEAISAFDSELPHQEQEKKIDQFVKEQGFGEFLPPRTVLKSMTAMRWYKARAVPLRPCA